MLIAIGVFTAQAQLSSIWLRRRRYGPAEWILRAFTNLEWPAWRASARRIRGPRAASPIFEEDAPSTTGGQRSSQAFLDLSQGDAHPEGRQLESREVAALWAGRSARTSGSRDGPSCNTLTRRRKRWFTCDPVLLRGAARCSGRARQHGAALRGDPTAARAPQNHLRNQFLSNRTLAMCQRRLTLRSLTSGRGSA